MATTKEQQSKLSPTEALELLKNGNQRFVASTERNRDLIEEVKLTEGGQHPFAAILSCMDSRVSAELVFDQGVGDIFSARVAGNIVDEDVLGSLEYAVKFAGSKLIIVLGHTKCGAVTGACNDVQHGNLTALLAKIKPAIEAETTTVGNRTGSNPDFVQNVIELNVKLTIEQMRKDSPTINELVSLGEIGLVGGVYDVSDGQVTFFE